MKPSSFKWLALLAVMAALNAPTPARAGDNLIGLGANYWRTVDKLSDDFDRDGLSWLVTYQRTITRLLALQADLEWFRPNFAGLDKDVFAPQAHVLVGGALYAGFGIGILYTDGDFNDKPFYNLRAGFDFEILPTIHFDLHANYQFSEWKKISNLEKDLGSDTITLGTAVRIEF